MATGVKLERKVHLGFNASKQSVEIMKKRMKLELQTTAPAAAAQLDEKGQGLEGEQALTVMRIAHAAKAASLRVERDEASEAFTSFQQMVGAMKGRMQSEVERVVEETRVRREAQLVREIERASGQLSEHLGRLSSAQLLSVTDELISKVQACSTRHELEQCAAQRALLEQRRLDARDFAGGDAATLKGARMRLDNVLAEVEARVTQAEIAARLAAETPLQRELREQMARNVHKLSSVFAAVDASGDGQVDRFEFRRVLPVLAVPGATEADSDALFLNLSRGKEAMGYRELFLELSRIARQQQAEKAAQQLAQQQQQQEEQEEQQRLLQLQAQAQAAADASPASKGPTPRAASAAKERPPAKKAAGAKPGAKKPPAKGGPRSASAPKARGTPLGK